MKKILSLALIAILCLSFAAPVTAQAAVKISKARATMEVDSTLKLKVTGTKKKISWSSNKKSVAKVSSSGTITAKAEGTATITAKVDSKKYTCRVTVVDSNKKISVKTIEDFEKYLSTIYPTLKTDMGDMTFKYSTNENDSDLFPYDFMIWVDWDGVDPDDIEHSLLFTDKQKNNTINALKDLQETIYKDAISFFPNKKICGSFLTSWYEYPTIHEGYRSISFLSWQNYTGGWGTDAYKKSKIDKFIWTPKLDDYDFTK